MSEWVLAIVVRKLLCVCVVSLRALPPHVFLYEWVCVRQVMLQYCPLIEDGVHSSSVFSHVSVMGIRHSRLGDVLINHFGISRKLAGIQ